MSYDLQFLRDRAPRSVTMVRAQAIYRAAEDADGRLARTRNVADLLERGHRPAVQDATARLLDLKA